VEDFESLVLTAQGVRGKLQDLGCFSDVGIHIDTSESGLKDYKVTFQVEEVKRVQGSVNTMVGNNEGSLMTGVKLPNLLGGGERLQADYTYGTKRSSNFNLSLLKPVRGRLRSTLTSSVYQSAAEQPASGFHQLDRGLLADLAFTSAPHVQHSLQYEAVWRNLSCLSRAAAFAVREHSGHSLKSSIKHVLSVDRRDSPVFPTRGTFFRLGQEFAGLGGNVGFFKNEVEVQANLPLGEQVTLQASLQGGLLRPLTGEKAVGLADLFYLGGPLGLRGFDMRGAGPSQDGCALGGGSLLWRVLG
jgi:outer membrane protein insertion porin family